MPAVTVTRLARVFDSHIRARGQLVSVYRPGRSVVAGLPTEAVPSLVGTTYAMLQFGEAVADLAGLAGVDPSQAARAFFLSSAASLVTERSWIKDAGGTWWLVHGRPSAEGLPGVIGVEALLTRAEKPVGVP